MNSTAQIYEFMGCIYAGLIMGIIYTPIDFLRRITGAKPFITVMLDALYVLICTVLACGAVFVLTYGRVAFYHFIGFFIGIFMYTRNTHALLCRLFVRR